MLVQSGHQVGKYLPVRVILDHADLLADDAPLLVHTLLGKPGLGDKGEEDAQIFLKLLGGFKIVSGNGAGGKCVGAGSVGRQVLEGIALLGVKHLVLQIVGHSGGAVRPHPVQAEAHIHAPVVGGKEGIALLKLRLGEDTHGQAVFQLFAVHPLPYPVKCQLFHVSPPVLSGNKWCPVPAFALRRLPAPG